MTSTVLAIIPAVDDVLFDFAQSDGFWANLETAFGTSYDVVKATQLRQQWQSRDFSQLPEIEVVNSSVLGGANGAYGISTNKIYLSESFFASASLDALGAVILEEIGHYVDAQINQVDSAGDEGAIFAELVRGNSLDVATLQVLKAEDDSKIINLNGEVITVEQNKLLKSGKIIVANDEFTLSDSGFSNAPDDSLLFAQNIANYFANGKKGSFLAYSDNLGFTGFQLSKALTDAGHQWKVAPNLPFTLETLQQYDGVFLGGSPVDNQVLIDYVNSGGNVYLMAGTGITGSFDSITSEANAWKDFLNNFGLSLANQWNEFYGNIPINPSSHPILANIDQLYQQYGQTIIDLNANDNQGVLIAKSNDGQGLYAIYDPNFQVNLITNGSFEISPDPGGYLPLNPGSTAITGWTVTRDQIDYTAYWVDADGDRSLDLNGSPGVGGIAQTFSTIAGQQYLVSFALAGNTYSGTPIRQLGVSAAGQSEVFSFDTTGFSDDNMGWVNKTWVFTATASTTTLEFYSLSIEPENAAFGPALDNVSVISLLPSITLAVAPVSVTEDGTTNLVYTFTRNGVTTNPLTVNYTVGGTATFNTDYTQTGAATFTSKTGTVTFAANSTTAKVTIDPTADTIVENNETVILTLAAGTGYTVGTNTAVTGTIFDFLSQGLKGQYYDTYFDDNLGFFSQQSPLLTRIDTNVNFLNNSTSWNLNTIPQLADLETFSSQWNGYINIPVTGNYTFYINSDDASYLFLDNATLAPTPTNATINNGGLHIVKEVSKTVNLTAGLHNILLLFGEKTADNIMQFSWSSSDANIAKQIVPSSALFNDAKLAVGSLAFSSPTFTVNENGTPVTAVTVTRTNGSDGAVSVTLTPSNGSAIAPSDYTNTPITVNFADGETSKIVTIPIVNDALDEANETINLTLSNPTNGVTLGTQKTATLTIIDNDEPMVSFSRANFQVGEDGKVFVPVTITRNGDMDSGSVTISLTDGTATTSQDYNPQTFTVTFNPGETTKTVDIAVVNDTVAETSETINLTLSNPTGNIVLGSQKTATLTIIDNDTVWAGFADVVLDYFDSGAGPIPGPYGFIGSGGTTPINLDAALGNDPDSSLVNTVTLPTGSYITLGFIDETIVDGPGNDIFVREDGAAGDRANVFVSSNFIDFTFLGVAQDNITTAFDLSSINYAQSVRAVKIVGLNLAGSVPGFDLVNVQVLNQGSAAGKLAFETANFSINENGTLVTEVKVIRTDGSYGQVSATINLTNGTAITPSDYTNTPITVNFANGETSKTVTIPIVNDSQLEADETVNLTLSNPTGGATLGTQTTAVLTIINDDLPQRGIISLNSSNYTVNENGTANITLTRTNGSDGEVSVILTPSNGSAIAPDDYTNTPITVTFANGETSKTVTIPVNNDTVYEPTETVNLTLSSPTGGATLGTQTTAVLNIIDNDAVPGVLAFSQANYSINEDGTPVVAVTVNRTGGSDGAVSATISLTDGTATRPDDYTNTSITVNFANGETSKVVTIPIVNDGVFEPNETLNLTLNNPTGGATLGTQTTAVLTIINDNTPPVLTLSTNKKVIDEELGNNAAIGTVTRNVVTNQDLIVTLTSSNTTEATVPVQVVIPAGQASANFDINVIDDGIPDGDQKVTLTATAGGYDPVTYDVIVTDFKMPDLVITEFSNSETLYTGKQSFFTYKVVNNGLFTADATADPLVDHIYLSSDPNLDKNDKLLADVSINGTILTGQFYQRNLPFFAPTTPGNYYLIAEIDTTDVVNEGVFGETNNLVVTPITVQAAYRGVVATDVEVGIEEQSIVLRGEALSNEDNSPIPFEFVTIAIKNNGFVREVSALTDINGNFVKTFKPLPGEAGTYEINAYFPGVPTEDTAPEDSFKLLGMRFTDKSISQKILADQTFTGQVTLQNLSDIPINGITYTVEGAPSDWQIQVNTPSNLAGSGQNTLTYTILAPNNSTVTQDNFNLRLTSTEGVRAVLPVTINLERIVPRLVSPFAHFFE